MLPFGFAVSFVNEVLTLEQCMLCCFSCAEDPGAVHAGVKGIWAVHQAEASDTGQQLTLQGGQHHTYLLMSHPASAETKVLETGEELAEVPADSSGFMLQSPTIAAGNVLSNTLIVQAGPCKSCW